MATPNVEAKSRKNLSRADFITVSEVGAAVGTVLSITGCVPQVVPDKIPENKDAIPAYIAKTKFFEFPPETFGPAEEDLYFGIVKDIHRDWQTRRNASAPELDSIYFADTSDEEWDARAIVFFQRFLECRNAAVHLAQQQRKIGLLGYPLSEEDQKNYVELGVAKKLAEADYASLGSLIWAVAYRYKNDPETFFSKQLDVSGGLVIDQGLYGDPLMRSTVEKYGAIWANATTRCSIRTENSETIVDRNTPPADLKRPNAEPQYEVNYPFFFSLVLDDQGKGFHQVVLKSNIQDTDNPVTVDPATKRPGVFQLQLTQELQKPGLAQDRQQILKELQEVIDAVITEEGLERLVQTVLIDEKIVGGATGGRQISIEGNSPKNLPWWHSIIRHEMGHAFHNAIMQLPDLERYRVLAKLKMLVDEFDVTRSPATLFGLSITAVEGTTPDGKRINDQSSISRYPLEYYARSFWYRVYSMHQRIVEPLSRLYHDKDDDLGLNELQLYRFLPTEADCNAFLTKSAALQNALIAWGVNIMAAKDATPFEKYMGNRIKDVVDAVNNGEFYQVYRKYSLQDMLIHVVLPYMVQQAIENDTQGIIAALKDPGMKSSAVPERLQNWDPYMSCMVSRVSSFAAVKQGMLTDTQGADSYRHELFAEIFSAALCMKKEEYFAPPDAKTKAYLERVNTFIEETKEILINNGLAAKIGVSVA